MRILPVIITFFGVLALTALGRADEAGKGERSAPPAAQSKADASPGDTDILRDQEIDAIVNQITSGEAPKPVTRRLPAVPPLPASVGPAHSSMPQSQGTSSSIKSSGPARETKPKTDAAKSEQDSSSAMPVSRDTQVSRLFPQPRWRRDEHARRFNSDPARRAMPRGI